MRYGYDVGNGNGRPRGRHLISRPMMEIASAFFSRPAWNPKPYCFMSKALGYRPLQQVHFRKFVASRLRILRSVKNDAYYQKSIASKTLAADAVIHRLTLRVVRTSAPA